MRPAPAGHREALEALGLSGEAARGLEAYLDLLAAWSVRTNLTAARTAAGRVGLLVAEVLPAAPLLEPGLLLDVGSGNGSPGLVLALLRPELPATLLEPRTRRWAFLREACRAAGRPDIRVLRVRHDGYEGPPARNLTLRGLRLPLAELAGLVQKGGQVLVLGGPPRPGGPFRAESGRPAGRGRIHVFRRTVLDTPAPA